ncbi:uncharacterized protein EV154DRAFT_479437 [Mucor mucedo]|uniref:uncharacterized protein n=1 Tax=Mucor mucedo TaxID=29922 RepID=UPI002220DC18|nr:uncharacterized protein EV154DRAFT_479437 [Mucor mucedo]KAI7893433.1 hypothetical protein EV154DRAFT_479437 [Mucor mucedo]
MGCWDWVPNELLFSILNDTSLKYHPKSEQHWGRVNRQWYYVFQESKYRHLEMKKVDSNERIFNNILYSSFQPGLVVDTLSIAELDRHEEMNRSISPLKVIMLKCPNLLHLLEENHVWTKLKHLEPPVNSSIYYKYYRCALYFKDTLEKLSLRADMMYVVDDMLKTFTALRCLTIDKNMYDDVQKCDFIFKALPTIRSLRIDFSDCNVDISKTKRESNANLFNRIQELELIGYTPFHDKDLMQLKAEFRTIKKLTILPTPGIKTMIDWPLTENIDSVIAFKFFIRYIHQIPSVELLLKIENLGWALKEFFEYYDNISGQGKVDSSLKVVFSENTRLSNRIHIKINKRNIVITVMFKEMIDDDTSGLWNQTSQNVDKVKLEMQHQLSNTETPLNTILSNYKNLRQLTIYRGVLINSLSVPVLKQSVEHLVFHDTLCHHDYFLAMSNAFPYLKSIHFEDCYFPYDSPKPHLDAITMLETTVDTFEYTYNHSDHCPTYTLLSVCSVDEHFQKFFLDVGTSKAMIEIPQEMFLNMVEHPGTVKDPMGCRETEVLYIKLKSVKQFVFNKKNSLRSKKSFVCNVASIISLSIK